MYFIMGGGYRMKWAGVILVIVICGVLLFNQPISAQQGIFQIQGYELPADNDLSLGVALGDMDSDGDNDIVLANRAGQNRLYINDGSGTFTDISLNNLPEDNDLTWGVTLGDVDGDADIDIIFINDGQNRLYLNDGSGNFTDASLTNLPEDNDASRSVFLADTDGDGDADIVIANDGQNRLYLNNASQTLLKLSFRRMIATAGGLH